MDRFSVPSRKQWHLNLEGLQVLLELQEKCGKRTLSSLVLSLPSLPSPLAPNMAKAELTREKGLREALAEDLLLKLAWPLLR